MPFSTCLKRNIIIYLILTAFLIGSCIDLYVPSLPAISSYFNVSNALVKLSISMYMLGYSLGQLMLSFIADSFGRKKIIYASVFIFVGISFLAAFSPSIYFLNFYRLIQGMSIAGLAIVCRALATDCFTGKKLTMSVTYISTSWALGPVLGPFIGGYLQHFFNWQADFYYFGIYGLVIFVYTILLLPETNRYVQPFHPIKVGKIIKMILTHKIFILISFFLSLLYGVLIIFNIVGPFLIQVLLKYSPVQYGHMALLLGFGYFLGNLLNRFLINHFEPLKIAFLALLMTLLISVVLTFIDILFTINIYIIIAPIFLLFFFCGLVFPNMMAKVLSVFPKNAGVASSIYGTILTAGVFFITLLATILKTTSLIPLAATYVALIVICVMIFFVFKHLEKIHVK